jgi:hypothetical protein
MLADTEAIRAFGHANAGHAADLSTLAASMSAVPSAAGAAALGPVGADFLAALAAAVSDMSRSVAMLGDGAATAGTTSLGSALRYDDAERRNGHRLGGL